MISKLLGRLIVSFVSKYRASIIDAKKSKLKKRGHCLDIDNTVVMNFPERIGIEDFVHIGPSGTLNGVGGLLIKRGTIIGPNVYIHTANHNFRQSNYLPYDEKYIFKEVIIGENVWIGANVSIAPGAIIGEGCIIGMGAVISGEIPPYSIVIGNPCKIVSTRNVEKYLELKAEDKIYLKAKAERIIKPRFD